MSQQGCGYQGYEFGAGRYPDSVCVDGVLWDADRCDSDGMMYEPIETVPCPMCDPRGAIRYWTDRFRLGGTAAKKAITSARSLVNDIRKNRESGTPPWIWSDSKVWARGAK